MLNSLDLFFFIEDADNLLECPFDKDHHVGATVFEDHTRICKLQNSGFSNVEIKVKL